MLTISNANPIQFWLTGQESFNQKNVYGIYPVCFCEHIDPLQTLRLDIRDSLDGTNHLLIYLEDGSLWHSFTFAATGFDHHQYLLIIGANGDWDDVVNKKLAFEICSGNCNNHLVFSTYNVWVNTATPFSGKSSTNLAKTTGDGDFTYGAYQPCAYAAGLIVPSIPLGISFTSPSGGNTLSVTIELKTSIGGSVVSSHTEGFSDDIITTVNYNLPALTGTATVIVIYAFYSGESGAHINLTIPNNISIFDGVITAFTDCIDVSTDESQKLISYSNSTDFAGLGFPAWSPPATYYMSFPAVFFDEDYPQEQEDLELSTDEIITLWSKIEGKKLLDIGFLPFYMHKKLQLILMMDTVSLDGIEYRKRDPYQITAPSSKRSALRRASVLLSEKDFIDRNL